MRGEPDPPPADIDQLVHHATFVRGDVGGIAASHQRRRDVDRRALCAARFKTGDDLQNGAALLGVFGNGRAKEFRNAERDNRRFAPSAQKVYFKAR